jgi:hypothetical protein
MNTAVSDELINRNPCSIRGAGIERTRERPLLDTTTVLALADTIEPRLRCLVLLAAACAPVKRSGYNARTSTRSTAPSWSCDRHTRSPVRGAS